jgi:lambda family phage portal protein
MSTPGNPSSATAQPTGANRSGRLSRALAAAWRELRGAAALESVPVERTPRTPRARAAYHGAEVTRLNLDWRTGNASADQDLRGSIALLRSRARDLARNNPYIERFLGLLVSNVLGSSGIGHQAQVLLPNGELDERTNDEIEAAWQDWINGPVTVDGKLTMSGFQALQLEAAAVDGESFTRLVMGREFRHGLGLQPIDADLVAENVNRRGGREAEEVRLGVEVDVFGRPRAYHVWDWPDYVPGSESRGLQRLSADEVLHHYRARRAHQTRGVTWLARVMTDIQDLAGYDESVIVGARAGANQVAFAQWKDPAAASPSEDRTPVQMELNPGTFTELDPGLEVVAFDPSQPSGMYADFTKTVLRRIASGLGLAYASLSNDLREANYSSARVGLLIEREMWRTLQDWWIASFLQPLYVRWLEAATLSGALVLPRADWREYAAVKWTPRGWPWVDPQSDVQASEAELHIGLTSRQRLSRERGRDFAVILEELRQEREMAAEAGVEIGGVSVASKPAPAAPGAGGDPAADPEADSADAPGAKAAGRAGGRLRALLNGAPR